VLSETLSSADLSSAADKEDGSAVSAKAACEPAVPAKDVVPAKETGMVMPATECKAVRSGAVDVKEAAEGLKTRLPPIDVSCTSRFPPPQPPPPPEGKAAS